MRVIKVRYHAWHTRFVLMNMDFMYLIFQWFHSVLHFPFDVKTNIYSTKSTSFNGGMLYVSATRTLPEHEVILS